MPKHKHKWEVLRRGYPQKICRCGSMWVPELHAGLKTVSIGADLATFSGSTDPAIQGDMSVINSRLRARVSGGPLNCRNADEPDALRAWQIAATPRGDASGGTPPTSVQSGISTTITETGALGILSTTHGQYQRRRTAGGVPPQFAGWLTSSFTLTQRQFFPTFTCAFTSDLLSIPTRFWIGLCSGNPSGADTGTLLHLAAIHFLTGTSASWNVVTNDGSVAANFIASGFPFSAGLGIIVTIQLTDTIARFTLRNGSDGNPTVVTTSTQLPALSTGLGFVARGVQLGGAVAGFGIRMVNHTQNQVVY